MNVLFVYPFFLNESALERQWMTPYPPLGLLSLAAVVRRAGHAVAVFDGTFASGDADFVAALETHRPDVVCFASLITLRPTALRLAAIARAHSAVTIAGGPDPTSVPEAYLLPDTELLQGWAAAAKTAPTITRSRSAPAENQSAETDFASLLQRLTCPRSVAERGPAAGTDRAEANIGFDLVVIGEADETLPELLGALQTQQAPSSIAGLIYREASGHMVQTAPRAPTPNLDLLPFPARDLIDVEGYLAAWRSAHGYSSLTVAASRGCPFGCEYCARSAAGPHWRVRSIDHVVRELSDLEAQYAPDRFRLVDDLGGLGRDWLSTLGRAMIAAGVRTPFEGLKPAHLTGVPMLAEVKDICAERNAWLPTRSSDAHATPDLTFDEVQLRWRDAQLPAGEHLSEPCPT